MRRAGRPIPEANRLTLNGSNGPMVAKFPVVAEEAPGKAAPIPPIGAGCDAKPSDDEGSAASPRERLRNREAPARCAARPLQIGPMRSAAASRRKHWIP